MDTLETVKLAGASVYADLMDAIDNASDQGKSTWITDEGGKILAAIVPAPDVHEHGQCCCTNCPWDGCHQGGSDG